MKKIESTDPRIQKAIVLYKSGKTIKSICSELHLDGSVVRRFLIDDGPLRTRAEAIRNGKSNAKIHDNILDKLTPDSLYWIGFLYADGHIEKEPRKRITLTISNKDETHLKKYCKFFGEGLQIRDVTDSNAKAPGQINFDGKYLRVGFSSKGIYDRLLNLGFTNNKTLNLIPDNELKNSRDFWRGVIDGDGHVCTTGATKANGKYDYACVGLSGTEDTLIGFLKFVKDNEIETEVSPYKDKRRNVWKLDIHNTRALKILDLLYKDSITYLERKYQKYQEIIQLNNIKNNII